MNPSPEQEPLDRWSEVDHLLESIGLPLARYSQAGKLIQASTSFQAIFAQLAFSAETLFRDPADFERLRTKVGDEPSQWHQLEWLELPGAIICARLTPDILETAFMVLALPVEDYHEPLTAALPAGLILFDKSGTVIKWNQTLNELIKMVFEEAAPRQADELWEALAARSTAPESTTALLRRATTDPSLGEQVEIELPAGPVETLQIKFFAMETPFWGALFVENNPARQQANWIFEQSRQSSRWGLPAADQPLDFGELTIDLTNRQVSVGDKPIDLTPTEFDLLSFLAQHAGQVLTHNQIIESLWPLGHGNRHSLFVHVNRLRSKLEPDPESPRFIVTRWGTGYTFFPSHRPG